MARPRLINGYLRFAHDLNSALAAVKLTQTERIVLATVLEQTFGIRKRERAILVPYRISRDTGFDRRNVIRAIRALCNFRIIKHEEFDSYSFNKDWESWVSIRVTRIEPAFDENIRRWVENAKDRSFNPGDESRDVRTMRQEIEYLKGLNDDDGRAADTHEYGT